MKFNMFMRWVILSAVVALVGWGVMALFQHRPELRAAATWQPAVSPGELSSAHAFLAGKCASCHTPVKGIEASNCIVCHASDRTLLQRQPTAFHATVQSCRECHAEHQGRSTRPSIMDHEAIARLLASAQPTVDQPAISTSVLLSPAEPTLNCAVCHSSKDKHFGLFGTDCAACHRTGVWSIPGYRHPPTTSFDCAQCHQAPPSHYMMHFKMVSMMVARKEHAQVSQCYLCHQTTSWNDIQGVGFYKHH